MLPMDWRCLEGPNIEPSRPIFGDELVEVTSFDEFLNRNLQPEPILGVMTVVVSSFLERAFQFAQLL